MAQEDRFEPEPYQVVSDLGQLQAFNETLKIQILRILQRQEGTIDQLASIVDESRANMSRHVQTLLDLRLIRKVGNLEDVEEVYRANARIFDLQPDPADNATVMAPVANATIESVRHDVVISLTQWPDQRMNFESRRLRMSASRAMEFDERLNALLAEFWGDPDRPVEEDSDAPVMAFAGIWYRFPDDT